jgi:vacuolar iron transporter family protein
MFFDQIIRFFARSPASIYEKRASLLNSNSQEDLSRPRKSADIESQTSTDASTLLEPAREDQKPARNSARFISDPIIGLSDGMTVPFALTAGLSAIGNTRVVIFAGMAELTAGAISMGLGGYLGAKSEESVPSTL